VNDNPVYIMCC